MTEISPQPRKRLMTSRQIGLAASLGGLAFAWRALGLAIPIVPPFVVDLCHTIEVLGAFSGGPIVSIVISILIGIPTWDTWIDMIGYAIGGLTLCLLAPTIWKFRDNKVIAHTLIWYYSIMSAYFIAPAYWLTMFHDLLQMIPFKEVMFWVWSPVGDAWIYTLLRGIPLSLVLELAPGFAEPKWSWFGEQHVGDRWSKSDLLGVGLFTLITLATIVYIIVRIA